MWSTEWFGFTLFALYGYFVLYSFFGWAMESAFVSLTTGKWVNRGFLNGPFCPIYGVGALLIILGLNPVAGSVPLLFIGGFLIASVVEYLIGAGMEGLFHASWWDYSQKPFNIKGRVCLERSLEWGLLSVFMMRVIQPGIETFVARLSNAWGELAATVLLAYLVTDGAVTILHVLRFNEKLAALSEAHTHLRQKLEDAKLFGSKREIAAHFENMTVTEAFRELKERIAEEDVEIQQLRTEERLRREFLLAEVRDKMERRRQALGKSSLTERRLMRAYPKLRSHGFDEELKAFRRETEERKKEKLKGKNKKREDAWK